jgi:LPS-assembly protein
MCITTHRQSFWIQSSLFSLVFTILFLVAFPVRSDTFSASQNYSTNGAPAAAAAADQDQETLITAVRMTSDPTTETVTASGEVEIARAKYVLHADKVTYKQKTGVMYAEGHVAILTPSGEVEFADREEITGDMKQAFVKNIGILFTDNSRLAARTAQRYDGRYVVANQAMFTACNVCKENPDNPPLWQLRAQTIVHDNVEHDVYYHNATLDFAGVPLMYTPYLSTPDPTVQRRQGFLTPSPGSTPNLGPFVRVPYYFDIAPDKDAVLEPTFSAKDGAQIAGEYRERFVNGSITMSGSFTHTDLVSDAGIDEGQQWRGNFNGGFLYNIDNVWRAGTDVAFVSDKSYLQRYEMSSPDELTSRAYVEGFKGRDYAVTNMYYFEDLRPGTQAVEPLVLPEMMVSAFGEPGKTWGGRWDLGASSLITTRDNKDQGFNQQGPDTRRMSLNGGWERQLVSDTGLVTQLSGLARADMYWADNVVNPTGTGHNFNNVLLARPFAQANGVVRYPMGRNGDGYQELIEPIVSMTAAPAVKVDPRQPIEDSLDLEFDETNLFSPNRFTGTDLIEGGSRAVYGLRHAITADNGARLDMFGGQSYDFSRNTDFPGLSGLHDQLSDYVGRIDFSPGSWLNLNYGARFDHISGAAQEQDGRLTFGVNEFRPSLQYISAYETDLTGNIERVREGIVGFSSNYVKYWTFTASHTQAFSPNPGPRTSSGMLTYNDECFIFGVGVSHDDTTRADVNSGTSVMFHFFLKNVGGIHTDSFSSPNFPAEFRQY